ncbi:MAG: SusC/RagA family TonB-linked outer membrane protein, partial [Dysgonamonadaceae bacterium]|nr:SusC/RagA family TonB-linked outer membrane protein [Dysgonamonadaceae bacterium]
YKGIDLSLSYRDRIGEFVYSISGIFSFTRDKQININEAYQEYDYLYHTGYSKNQVYGLEAIGLFNSQVEINNSPVQSFSVLRPGDIKYKDQNGDNVIDEKDVIRMYKTSVPEVYYGFSFNLAWRNFSMNVDFQGVTNKTVSLLNSPLYQPLVNNGNISQTFLDNEKTWTPEDPNNVSMPRLTTQTNNNNYRQGTLWYRNGSFLKLRNLEVAYDFPVVFRAINKMRLYLRGSNLFSIDHIKFADPEQLQASYPSLRLFWAGIKLHF